MILLTVFFNFMEKKLGVTDLVLLLWLPESTMIKISAYFLYDYFESVELNSCRSSNPKLATWS